MEEFDIPAEAVVVGCSANARPHKGLHVLVEALSLMDACDVPIHFLLVGHVDRTLVRQVAADRLLRDRVHFAGYRHDAPALMGTCDLFVLPSLLRKWPSIRAEGLPKGVIEAMAQGVPAIVTNAGGSPEIVRHEVDGLVVPPGDADALARAIQKLANDPDLRATYGLNARDRIRSDFHIDTTVAAYQQLYAALLNG